MTRTSKTMAVVYGLAFVVAVALGGRCVDQARWLDAASAYGLAGLLLAAMLREIGRTLPGDYTDDEPAPVKEAGPIGRLQAAREARRVIRASADPCACRQAWTTCGAAHDPLCPQSRRRVA